MREVPEGYLDSLERARTGEASHVSDAHTPFGEVKTDFYADSRVLNEEVLKTLKSFEIADNPYGLVDRNGEPDFAWQFRTNPWTGLEQALASTVKYAYDITRPPLAACPYHVVLAERLGTRSLAPFDNNETGLDTLREVSVPGGLFAPALVVNLVRRIPAARALFQMSQPAEDIARSSRGLLREPLTHPQQWAKAFMLTLADGNMFGIDRGSFLSVPKIQRYLEPYATRSGRQALRWSMPTADFLTTTKVDVVDRTRGSENDVQGDHIVEYPAGTRLGDISISEPTIGCPGDQIAYWMFSKTIDIAVGENLWFQD